jgi:hypothetical protein
MATGGTPEAGMVFRLPSVGGRGTSYEYSPTPYAKQYGASMAELGLEEKLMGMEIQASQEERAQKSFDLSNLREARLQKQQDLKSEAELRAEARNARLDELKFNEIEKKQGREHDLVEISSKIDDIDPMHKDAIGQLNELRHDSTFTRLLAHPETRDALKNVLMSKTSQIQDIVGVIQQEAKSKYGIDANLSEFPTKEDGTWDLEKGYKEHLPAIADQIRQQSESAYEIAPEKPGYTKYKEMDAYGRPVTKFVKTEDLNKQKLEEMRLTRGGQMQALSAIQALRQESASTLSGFKQKELQNPSSYLDENGKPTKDVNKAATAIWKVKGKEVARLPENERQDRIQKIESLNSQIQDWTSIAMPKQDASKPTEQSASVKTPSATTEERTPVVSTEASTETDSQPIPVSSVYSKENPYAASAVKEQEEAQAKTAKEKQQKEKAKAVSGWYNASQEEKVAEQLLGSAPYTKTISVGGSTQIVPLTEQEKAREYESRKANLDSAKAKRLWHEARDPEWVNINLKDLQGDELQDFKNNYLAPAIFEEAGGDPQKARAIANQRGYSFE